MVRHRRIKNVVRFRMLKKIQLLFLSLML